MKRNLITLQFIENGLIILNKDKLNKYIIKSVNNYQVINKESFIQDITRILAENNINNHLLTDNLNIIVDSTYLDTQLSILKEIFKEISFNKIEFINQEDLLKPKYNEIIVDISINNIKIITKDNTIQTKVYYHKHKQILSIYLKNIIKDRNIQCIKLYGNYTYTNKFIKELEQICKVKTYIYTQPDLMPIRILI